MHPKALEAQQRRDLRARQREAIALAKRDAGVHFTHSGPYTICWRPNGRNLLVAATSIRNPTDRPDRLTGESLAWNRMRNDQHIYLKRPASQRSNKLFLQGLFNHVS